MTTAACDCLCVDTPVVCVGRLLGSCKPSRESLRSAQRKLTGEFGAWPPSHHREASLAFFSCHPSHRWTPLFLWSDLLHTLVQSIHVDCLFHIRPTLRFARSATARPRPPTPSTTFFILDLGSMRLNCGAGLWGAGTARKKRDRVSVGWGRRQEGRFAGLWH